MLSFFFFLQLLCNLYVLHNDKLKLDVLSCFFSSCSMIYLQKDCFFIYSLTNISALFILTFCTKFVPFYICVYVFMCLDQEQSEIDYLGNSFCEVALSRCFDDFKAKDHLSPNLQYLTLKKLCCLQTLIPIFFHLTSLTPFISFFHSCLLSLSLFVLTFSSCSLYSYASSSAQLSLPSDINFMLEKHSQYSFTVAQKYPILHSLSFPHAILQCSALPS